jgi:hypothetical protein
MALFAGKKSSSCRSLRSTIGGSRQFPQPCRKFQRKPVAPLLIDQTDIKHIQEVISC